MRMVVGVRGRGVRRVVGVRGSENGGGMEGEWEWWWE